jgi:uncharacterized membrane protein
MEYETLKWVHIISATLLFGTGLGSAFYKYSADRSCDLGAIAHTNKTVVLADWLFTTPTVFIQPLTGVLLAKTLALPLTTPWVLISLGLFATAGLCWLPVLWLQIRMRDIAARALQQAKPLNATYHRYARIWFWLGVPAFISIIAVFVLMVFKSSLF